MISGFLLWTSHIVAGHEISVFFIPAAFFLVEIIVGYVTNSIALVADSFHMLSDVLALIVAFAAVRVSKVGIMHIY